MSDISVFNEVIARQIQGVMFHDDCANLFDFMALRGFKRQSEYRALAEFSEMRGVNRYVINHLSVMPNPQSSQRAKAVIPNSWLSATRYNVSESDRKNKVKELFTAWVDWEKETKQFYQRKFVELTNTGSIASANKINELIKDVDDELKLAERCWLTWNAVNWDMAVIVQEQDEIHDKYEKLTEEYYKVKFC